MKPLFVLLALAAIAWSEETIVTVRGERLEKATVRVLNPVSVSVTHSGGVATLPFAELPEEVRRRHGYDEAKAKAWLAQSAATPKPVDLLKPETEEEKRRRLAEAVELWRAVGRGESAVPTYDPVMKRWFASRAEAEAARREMLRRAGAIGAK